MNVNVKENENENDNGNENVIIKLTQKYFFDNI